MADYEIIEGVRVTDADEWSEIREPSRAWLLLVPLAMVLLTLAVTRIGGSSSDEGAADEAVVSEVADDEAADESAADESVPDERPSTLPAPIQDIPTEPEQIPLGHELVQPFHDQVFLSGAIGQPMVAFELDDSPPVELGFEGEPALVVGGWLFMKTRDGVGVLDMDQPDAEVRILVEGDANEAWISITQDEVWVYGFEDGRHQRTVEARRFALGTWKEGPSTPARTDRWRPTAALTSAPGGGVYEMGNTGYERKADGSLVNANRDYALVRQCQSPDDCGMVVFDRSDWSPIEASDPQLSPLTAFVRFMPTGPLATLFGYSQNEAATAELIDLAAGTRLKLQPSTMTRGWEPLVAAPGSLLVWSEAGLALIDRASGELFDVGSGGPHLPPYRLTPVAVGRGFGFIESRLVGPGG